MTILSRGNSSGKGPEVGACCRNQGGQEGRCGCGVVGRCGESG